MKKKKIEQNKKRKKSKNRSEKLLKRDKLIGKFNFNNESYFNNSSNMHINQISNFVSFQMKDKINKLINLKTIDHLKEK